MSGVWVEVCGELKIGAADVVNVDVTLLAELPRIGPHREAMRAQLAELLGIAAAVVNIKATTTEQLGFVGRREGLAAQVVVLLESAAAGAA